jgi:hypothetical protein
MLHGVFDGNWIDMLTVSSGLIAISIKPALRNFSNIKPFWMHRDALNDFLSGASIIPFILLLAAPFSSWILKELLLASKVSLGLAGGIGVLHVMKELFSIRLT